MSGDVQLDGQLMLKRTYVPFVYGISHISLSLQVLFCPFIKFVRTRASSKQPESAKKKTEIEMKNMEKMKIKLNSKSKNENENEDENKNHNNDNKNDNKNKYENVNANSMKLRNEKFTNTTKIKLE